MRRIAIGGVTGLAAWLGSSLLAEAQVGGYPTGPTAVTAGSSSSTYTSDVTSPGNFKVLLKVYHNDVGKHNSTTDVNWLGGVCPFSKVVDMTIPSPWGHVVGDQLRYWTRVYLCSNPMIADIDNWYVTVSDGGETYFVPNRDRIRERTGVDLV